MIAFPNAKINLGLHITGRRPDGYHEIESVFVPVPWRDILEIVPVKGDHSEVHFTSSGIEIPESTADNLCEQAYHLFRAQQEVPSVRMHLHKCIPIGAGLGGGSADAAFAAVMLNHMFDCGFSPTKLEAMVTKIGSDCPFFVRNSTAYVTGRGEKLEFFGLDLSGVWIALIDPGIHISTKDAYANITPTPSSISLREVLMNDMELWKDHVRNDFEASVFPKYPELSDIKEQLYNSGAHYAAMTGSGSTLFGLFRERPQMHDLQQKFATHVARFEAR